MATLARQRAQFTWTLNEAARREHTLLIAGAIETNLPGND